MLEKILEEIDRLHTKILNDKFACKVTEQEITALVNVKHMLRKRMNDGWILVEEKMPEVPNGTDDVDCPEFNVTVKGADIATTLKYAPDGTWFDDDGYVYNVIAWQPLPEPYRPEKGRE